MVVSSSYLEFSFGPVGAPSFCEKKKSVNYSSRDGNCITFLGTGSSTGCPKPLCTMLFGLNDGRSRVSRSSGGSNKVLEEMRERFHGKYNVSSKAIVGDPQYNKNYRNNPSLLFVHYDDKDERIDEKQSR